MSVDAANGRETGVEFIYVADDGVTASDIETGIVWEDESGGGGVAGSTAISETNGSRGTVRFQRERERKLVFQSTM